MKLMTPEELEMRAKIKKEEDEELQKAIKLSLESMKEEESKVVSVIPPKYAERLIATKMSSAEKDPVKFAETALGLSRKDMSDAEWRDAADECTCHFFR